jgi:hypothetical protein
MKATLLNLGAMCFVAAAVPSALTGCERESSARRAEERRSEDVRADEQRRVEQRADEQKKAEEKRLEDQRKAEEKKLDDQTRSTKYPLGQNTDAVNAIAQARCERESRCHNVGANEKYASADACKAAILSSVRDDLNKYDCPRGVDSKELQECLAEVRNEDCSSPFDTIGRLMACRSGELCAK